MEYDQTVIIPIFPLSYPPQYRPLYPQYTTICIYDYMYIWVILYCRLPREYVLGGRVLGGGVTINMYIYIHLLTYMDCDQHVVNKYSWDIYVFSTYIYNNNLKVDIIWTSSMIFCILVKMFGIVHILSTPGWLYNMYMHIYNIYSPYSL